MNENPTGFVESGGLVVPSDMAQRKRQVWTKDEWKLVEKFTKLATARGIVLHFTCQAPTCKHAPLVPKRLGDGSFRLRCNCTDRVMLKHF